MNVGSTIQAKSISMVDILRFENQKEFDQAIEEVNTLSSGNKKIWSKGRNFRSMYDYYIDALTDVAFLAENPNNYNCFMAKYKDILYFPDYLEDAGPYLKVKNTNITPLLNKEGNVIIGNDTINYIDINSYRDLQETNRSLYKLENLNMISTAPVFDFTYGANKGILGPVFKPSTLLFNSGYTLVDVEFGREIVKTDFNKKIYFELKAYWVMTSRCKVVVNGKAQYWSVYSHYNFNTSFPIVGLNHTCFMMGTDFYSDGTKVYSELLPNRMTGNMVDYALGQFLADEINTQLTFTFTNTNVGWFVFPSEPQKIQVYLPQIQYWCDYPSAPFSYPFVLE